MECINLLLLYHNIIIFIIRYLSTFTEFKRVFYGLNISSKVYITKIRAWTVPYVVHKLSTDQLSVLRNDYANSTFANFSVQSGTLEITQRAGRTMVTNDEWSKLLNMVSYRLYIKVTNILYSFVVL